MAYTPPSRTAVVGQQGTAYTPPSRTAVTGQQGDAGSALLALTGLAAAATGGTLTPLSNDKTVTLSGLAATNSRGVLIAGVDKALAGQAVTSAQGVLGFTRALTGLAATTAAGTVTPADVYVVLTGGAAATAQGMLGTQIGSDISVALTGQSATAAQGALPTHTSVGFVAEGALAPALDVTSHSAGDWVGYIRNMMLPAGGYYVGTGEWYNPSGYDDRNRAGLYKVSYETQTTWPWDKDGYPAYYTVDHLDIDFNWTTYSSGLNFPRAGTRAGDQSDWNYDSALSAHGGFFSVSPDGDVQSTVVRERVNVRGTFPFLDYSVAHLKSADSYYTWQQGDPQVNGEQYSGPEFRRGVTDLQTGRFSAPLGLYAVGRNRSLLFYAQPHDASVVGVQVRLTGLEARLAGQYGLTPVNVGDGSSSPLTGHTATTRQGSLENFVTSPAVVPLTGLVATARRGVLDGDSGNDYVVPALSALTYVDSSSRWGKEERLVPASQTFAIDQFLTIVPSGYGDIIYAVYLSGTHVAPTTPSKVGVVVMNAVTREVFAHTLTALGALTRATLYVENAITNAGGVSILPHRSVAHVHKLSSGTSLTQFQIGGYIVKLSWTEGTATSPTVTPKDTPTLSTLSYLIGGFETLEVKGDRVHHVLYERDSYLYNRIRYQYNDATADDSTWTRHVPATDVSTTSYYPVAYSGFGVPNRRSWLYLALYDYIFSPIRQTSLTFWLNWWGAEPPLMSVESAGRVGRVVVVIEDINKTVELTGQAATTAAGTIQRAGGNFVVPTGLRANTAQGEFYLPDRWAAPVGQTATATAGTLIGGQVAALTGYAATTAQGTLVPSVSAGAGLQPLTGLRATISRGYVWFSGAQLEGQRATLQWTCPSVQIDDTTALTGQAATTVHGTVVPETRTALVGRSAATARGTIAAGVAVEYWNFHAEITTRAGVLTPYHITSLQLAGLRANTAQGVAIPLSEKSNAATGYAATATSGAVVTTVVVSLTGAAAGAQAGVVLPLVSVTPTGRVAVSGVGVLQLLANIALTGKAGTCAIGSVGYAYSGGAILSGVYSKGETGDVTQSMWKPRSEHLLWVYTAPEELEVERADADEYALVTPGG